MAILEIRNKVESTGHSNFTGPGYNVMHVVPTTSSDSIAAAAIADIVTFYNALLPYIHTGTTITVGERVRRVDVVPAAILGPTPTTVVGTSTNSRLPAEVCCVVSWRTGLAGARYRGRTYLGPLTATALDTGGNLAGALVSGMQSAGATLLANLLANPTPTPLHVYSRKYLTSNLVIGVYVDLEPDTQRRRGR